MCEKQFTLVAFIHPSFSFIQIHLTYQQSQVLSIQKKGRKKYKEKKTLRKTVLKLKDCNMHLRTALLKSTP